MNARSVVEIRTAGNRAAWRTLITLITDWGRFGLFDFGFAELSRLRGVVLTRLVRLLKGLPLRHFLNTKTKSSDRNLRTSRHSRRNAACAEAKSSARHLQSELSGTPVATETAGNCLFHFSQVRPMNAATSLTVASLKHPIIRRAAIRRGTPCRFDQVRAVNTVCQQFTQRETVR